MKGFFITGTDTGCGKTEVSLALVQALRQQGLKVQAMKPVASGCELGPKGLRNADASRLLALSSQPVPYAWVNPYAFAPAIAPHLAAREADTSIELTRISEGAAALAGLADLVIVEGVGGWRVPLGPGLFASDLPRALGLPVILVVGLRLGCINHALLTAESILASGNPLAGWVANQVDPVMERLAENLDSLEALLPAPCLGRVPWLAEPSPVGLAAHLANPSRLAALALPREQRR